MDRDKKLARYEYLRDRFSESIETGETASASQLKPASPSAMKRPMSVLDCITV